MLIQLIYKNIHLKYHIGNNYCAPSASRKCFINSCFSVCPPICLPSVTSFPPNFFISFFFFFSKFCTMIPTQIWKKLGSTDFLEKS